MIRWIPYVFIRIVIFFIAGIVTGIYWPDAFPFWIGAGTLLSLVVLYILSFFVFFGGESLYKRFDPWFIAWPAIFLAGYLHVVFQTDSRQSDHLSAVRENIDFYQVVITGYPESKGENWKVAGKVLEIYSSNDWKRFQGNILLYFKKNDFEKSYQYGDVLLVKGAPQKVPPPSNPHEFDYQKFLSYKNIYHQDFLSGKKVEFVKYDPPSGVIATAMAVRSWSVQTLAKYLPDREAHSIASALVLGVTDGLDHELLSAYASTGAMHVLAVSGLHVSIIYWIILLVLKPFETSKKGKWIITIISMFVLWSYAFVTGLSPSVLRAVTMFSFLAIGRASSKDTNIFNTLAISAFCLLLLDPFLIMSVGFQLSYLAVIGIVYIYPLLFPVFECKSRIVNQVWKITAVSIAAQLATFPLGLLYFHQFPNYFLLSNLLVIPLSFGVLILGLALLSFSWITFVAQGFAILLGLVIKLMNYTVKGVEWLPFSLLSDINISVLQCWLLFCFVGFTVLMLEYKRYSYFLISALSITLVIILQWSYYLKATDEKSFIVYNVHHHAAIEMINDGTSVFIYDEGLPDNKIDFHINPNRLAHAVSSVTPGDNFTRVIQGGKIWYWNNMIFLQITNDNFVPSNNLHFDYVIISNQSVKDIESLTDVLNANQFILDSSNSYYYCRQMLNNATSKGINIYSVAHQGAYIFTDKQQS